ncbi:carboxylic ester hydrolase [Pseudoclavibacter endophyticus]|uniref:Carboxylic ester hydrolase n=1 Tax=Pseudoclavibacter endophyticus TaxID=1778590 RepID=A0A6H9WJK1_9MICO|nr:carboxylesterase family protein [Pseudoclavibacter endophyticus]KAB1649373.1 carboxylesterase/lipase family protein [Pseudoclavibacter endophyticus]GGA63125.1 carboxylic ester hydrolase [Pseudoclavibacter endophyticus]
MSGTYVFTGPHGERIEPSAVVETHLGPVQGLVVDGIHRFLGMRYAAAPTGLRRFTPPVDPRPWTETAEAIHYGAPAMQGVRGPETAPRSDFALTQMVVMPIGGLVKINSEDCLWLNVWTPATDGAKRPVLFWIHGGGFAYGAGSEPLYDGARLAARGDAVIVTVNHRLNLFGYLNLVGTHPHYDDAVNVGQQDLVHALSWVRTNIAAFGGDPDNVTIAGESGGAAKVNALMAMPSATGLFHKAIMQSGAHARLREGDAIRGVTDRILAAAGVDEVTPEALAALPATELLESTIISYEAQGDVEVERIRAASAFQEDLAQLLGPTRDGVIVPAHPYDDGTASGIISDVPVLMGWMKDEWNLMLVERDPGFVRMSESDFLAAASTMFGATADRVVDALRRAFPDYSPGHLSSAMVSVQMIRDYKRIADMKSLGDAPVYCYQVEWETPVGDGIYRTTHALDLPLVFDNVDRARAFVGEGDEPQLLADQMSEAWLAFMRTGSPDHSGIPTWPTWEPNARSAMAFDVTSRVTENPFGELDELTEGSRLQF